MTEVSKKKVYNLRALLTKKKKKIQAKTYNIYKQTPNSTTRGKAVYPQIYPEATCIQDSWLDWFNLITWLEGYKRNQVNQEPPRNQEVLNFLINIQLEISVKKTKNRQKLIIFTNKHLIWQHVEKPCIHRYIRRPPAFRNRTRNVRP